MSIGGTFEMTEKMPKRKEYLRYLHELMFSMNNGYAIALAVWFFMFQPSHLNPTSRMERLRAWINYYFRLDRLDATAGNIILFASAIGSFLFLLLVLHLAARTAASRVILDPVAAITSMGAVLASWLSDSSGPSILYLVGLEFAVICGFLYLARGWRIPIWCSGPFLVIHFSFWGWGLWQYPWHLYFRPHAVQPFAQAVPVLLSLVSPCSALVWALYRSRPRAESV